MTELHSHFKSILNNAPRNVAESRINYLREKATEFINNNTPNPDTVPTGNYTINNLCKLTKKLKNGKSAFIDGSLNEVIKHSIHNTAPALVIFFNHIEEAAIYPRAWKSSFLVPLHKKGSRDDPDNYRGLAIGSNISKLYTHCLNTKLKQFIEMNEFISPQQFGFRDDFRTTDAIFSLRSMVSLYKNNSNKAVYSCFVDFSKAFDSVNRIALAYKLGIAGIRGKVLKLLQDMYNSTDYIIKSGGKFSVPINSAIGVKQGCNLSPLFIQYLYK